MHKQPRKYLGDVHASVARNATWHEEGCEATRAITDSLLHSRPSNASPGGVTTQGKEPGAMQGLVLDQEPVPSQQAAQVQLGDASPVVVLPAIVHESQVAEQPGFTSCIGAEPLRGRVGPDDLLEGQACRSLAVLSAHPWAPPCSRNRQSHTCAAGPGHASR